VITDPARSRWGLPLPQIAAGDFDIAVIGQLPPPKFPLGDQFEPGSVKVVGFKAAFRGGGLWKQRLEHTSGHANDAFIRADADAKLDVAENIGQQTGDPVRIARVGITRASWSAIPKAPLRLG
jgi:hypothetical protein